MTRLLTHVVLPVVLVLAGVALAGAMILLAPSAEPAGADAPVPEVEVVRVEAATLPAKVTGSGVVVPDRRVPLSALVAGELVEVAADLRPGRRFVKGEVIARVDPRDYRAAVAEARSRVEQAQLELALERGRQDVAEREWELLGEPGEQPGDVVLRQPHLATAKQSLEAARAALDRAELNLARTRITAPFDAVVLDEQIEEGQYVAPGASLVTLAGTDRFRVEVPVPYEKLAQVEVPGVNASGGSSALVTLALAGDDETVRAGRVIGLAGQLDPQTRMGTVQIEITDPLDPPEGGMPLWPNAYVEASIEGRRIADVYVVPRTALSEGDKVWVVTGDDTLAKRTVRIAWSGPDVVYVTGGLEPGVRVVRRPMSRPIEGMAVTVRDGDGGG